MKPLNLLTLLFIGLVFSACHKVEKVEEVLICGVTDSAMTLTFGTFYGECAGDGCTRLYLIKDGQLFVDDVEYLVSPITFKPNPLPAEKYEIARELASLEVFPAEFFGEEKEVFGCPDCADQGGYYLEWEFVGQHKIITIDTNESEQPEYLKPYLQKMREVMGQL